MRRFALTLLAALSPVAAATSWVKPTPTLVATDYGSYGFKFLPKAVGGSSAKESWGELFQLQADGTLKTLWKHPLVNTPARVLIGPRGHVVTLDNWGGENGTMHAVVIYDPTGKVVADLNYSQVTSGFACARCNAAGGPLVTLAYTPKYTSYGNADEWFLLLRDDKGRGPTISLRTGKHKTDWNGKKTN
ncbi:hypothetical protein [Deinococcus wulumuqiensis]|uniref:hypothetical protein n=1 Tax=Deinococcus wulumuqiensis TaxID=980427 RepID=UPI00242E3379|nr:hypothetical protein [Deinococcus wulumuqiensis]